MCLGIPMRIIETDGADAIVESGGIRKSIRLDLLEGIEKGDYVLVHAGYAIEKLDRAEALETLDLIRQVYEAGWRDTPVDGS
jgi:hydrogenase expression/formation protein HypC